MKSNKKPPPKKKEKVHKCEECSFHTHKNDILRTHIEKVHMKIKKYHCPECNHSTYDNATLQNHIQSVHLKIKRFRCSMCDYKAFAAYVMRRHERFVHKLFKCSKCGDTFSSNEDLNDHWDMEHPNNSQPNAAVNGNDRSFSPLQNEDLDIKQEGLGELYFNCGHIL